MNERVDPTNETRLDSERLVGMCDRGGLTSADGKGAFEKRETRAQETSSALKRMGQCFVLWEKNLRFW